MSILKSKEIIIETLRKNNEAIEIKGDLLIELQKTELDIFRNVKKLCDENNIDIILGGGTLLGAVRHNGYIPWDDDIDLNISRKYVSKFIELLNDNFGNVYDIEYRNKKQLEPFIKIKKKGTILYEPWSLTKDDGVSIDIFIIENLPNYTLVRYFYGIVCTIKLYIASCLSFYENRNDSFIKIMKSSNISRINYATKKTIGCFFSYKTYNTRVIENDKYFSKYENHRSKYVCIPTGRKHFFGEIYKRNMFEDLVNTKFEGIDCKIPKDYDEYLRNLYGDDYMTIPPENKREHHYVFEIKL